MLILKVDYFSFDVYVLLLPLLTKSIKWPGNQNCHSRFTVVTTEVVVSWSYFTSRWELDRRRSSW